MTGDKELHNHCKAATIEYKKTLDVSHIQQFTEFLCYPNHGLEKLDLMGFLYAILQYWKNKVATLETTLSPPSSSPYIQALFQQYNL